MSAPEGVSTERSLTEAGAANLFEQMIGDDTVAEETQDEGDALDEGEQDIEPDTGSEDDEDADDAAPAPPSKYRVKVGGEELDVTLDEALKGYSRTEDYTRKTQKHAEKVRAFEQEARAVQHERARYAASLQQLEQIAYESHTEPDWGLLRQELSPEEYSREWTDHQIAKERLTQIATERAQVHQLQQQDALRARAQQLEYAKEELLAAVPEWKDPAKARDEMGDMADFVLTRGFPSGTFETIDDPKIFLLVRDALKYQKLQQSKPVAGMKATVKPTLIAPTIKPLAAGSSVPSKKSTNELTRARQRLAQSGSDRDAAAVFEKLL